MRAKIHKTHAKGITHIVGIDEVGRGPIAGPVGVGAVCMPLSYYPKYLHRVRDSKKLSEKQREEWKNRIQKDAHISFATTLVGSAYIDKKGIVKAIEKGIASVLEKLAVDPRKTLVLLDGGIRAGKEYLHQETIIKGDEKVHAIALASIVAKLRRDRYMCMLENKYPEKYAHFYFSKHKGYGTKEHRVAIQKNGMSNQHRRTFCH